MKKNIWIFILLLLLAGCALPPEIEEGDQAMKSGNFDLASEKYGTASRNNPEEKSFEEKFKKARDLAAQKHLARGKDLRKNEFDLEGALGEFDLALKFQPALLEARKAKSEIQAYLKTLKEKIREAQEASKRKDWFRAEKLLWYYRKYSKTFPEIDTLWKRAAEESFSIYMTEGMRYYYLNQYKRAESEFKEAARLKPGDDTAKKRLELTQKKRESKTLFYETIEAMQKKEFSQARELIQKSLKLDPTNKRSMSLFAEATRNRAKTLVEKAQKDRESGKFIEAYKALLEARALNPSGALLKKKLDDRFKDIQKRIAARWYVMGDKFERQGLYGAAWIRFRQAVLLWPGFSNASKRIEEIEKKIPQTLHFRLAILPTGGTGTRVRHGELKKIALVLTAELQKKLPTKLFSVYPYGDVQEGLVQGVPLSGVLALQLDQFEILPTAKREEKQKKYIAAVGRKINPKKLELWKDMNQAKKTYEDLTSKWKNTQEDLKRKESALDEAKKDLEEYEQKNPPKKTLTPQEEGSDPRAIKIKELKTLIESRRMDLENFKTSRVSPTESKFQAARDSYETIKGNYRKEEVFLEEKYPRIYRYTRITITKTGTAQIKLTLVDFISKKNLLEETFNHAFQKTDTTQKGFSPAGVEEDNLQLPSNEEISKELIRGLMEKALVKIQETLQPAQQRFEEAMNQAGKTPSLHFALLAYKARQEPSYRARNRLKIEMDRQLAKKILDLTGYDIEKDRLITDKLQF